MFQMVPGDIAFTLPMSGAGERWGSGMECYVQRRAAILSGVARSSGQGGGSNSSGWALLGLGWSRSRGGRLVCPSPITTAGGGDYSEAVERLRRESRAHRATK